ncbi:NADPH-dependent 2,4-dienoyl-CoA reductase [Microbacterium kribbense]|uniref:NADPH-dependent 2,4-dienoyl-CoA reductase n=1 Tax=Microbacterium kribbense TaxID=433645 RepID=A0ABP7GAC3_9MICO
MSGTAARYPSAQTPVTIGALTLPHRVLMGSMHLNRETGDAAALAAFYAERARGGAALIITGGAAVNRVGAGSAGYTLLDDPAHLATWRVVVDAVHEAGGRIALQLFHAGRYAFESSFSLTPVAPSAVHSRFSGAMPLALDEAGIAATIDDFAAGARTAIALGFDGVEVMASEGYLLNQFASPVTNLRDDAWGGDAVRRRAFPLAVTRAVRAAIGSAPLIVRISGADLVPGSSTPEEVDALAVALAGAGADALDVGIGWHEARVPTVQSMVPHGAFTDVSARIRRALARSGAPVPVIAANRINALAQAERVLADGAADLVSMARPFLADPHIVADSFAGRQERVNVCIGCNEACIDRSFGLEPISCTVNPRAGRELEFPLAPQRPRGHRARIAVVGAGPAGMEAARAAAFAGAQVTLFEAAPAIGGQFLLAGAVPGKEDFLQTAQSFERVLDRLDVDVRCGRAVTAADLAGFAHVIIATGVLPRRVDLPGADGPNVIDYAQAFAGLAQLGARIAVIGAGGIAVDLAHLLVEGRPPDGADGSQDRDRFLIENGLRTGILSPPARQVTIMRRSGPIGAGMGMSTRWAAVQAIRRRGVRTLTGVGYHGIEPGGVRIEIDGAAELIAADVVVIAAGQTPRAQLAAQLAERGIAHTLVGGARETAGLNAVAAFEQGLRAGDAAARASRVQTAEVT